MKYQRCEFGHYYDPEKHAACPHCRARSRQDEYTVAKTPVDERVAQAYDLEDAAPIQAPVRKPAQTAIRQPAQQAAPVVAAPGMEEDSVTIARVEVKTGMDPVVGWFVQLTGQNKGKTYEIHSERNTIGRANGMDICLKGDLGVSRDTNGVISYNPRNRAFHLIPGEGKAIIYVNGEELLTPVEMKPYDKVEISETKLLFLPLCGERFAWEDEE